MFETFGTSGSARLTWRIVSGALVALTVVLASRDGPMLTPDSMHYVGAAHALAGQGTLRVPSAEWHDADSTEVLQQFPPGYPSMLALLLRVGASQETAIRAVDAAAASALVMLMLWLGDIATNAWSVRVAVPALVIGLRAIPAAWMSAWSEPLFLVAVAATLAMMVMFARRSWTYGLMAALGNAVRYAGVSLLLAALVWAGWSAWRECDHTVHRATSGSTTSPATMRARLLRVVRALLLAGAPGVVFNGWWLLRARLHQVETPVATVAWMGNLAEARDEAVRTITEQLVPIAVPGRGLLACVMLAIVGAMIGYAIRRSFVRHDHVAASATMRSTTVTHGSMPTAKTEAGSAAANSTTSTSVLHASLLIGVCYLAMLMYARLFVGGSIPLDDRLLAPLLLVLGLATLVALQQWLSTQAPPMRRTGYVLAGCWLVLAVRQSVLGERSVLADRDDYGSEYWTDTPVADWLRGPGRAYTLFSDDPVGTYFVTGRPSRTVPPMLVADTTVIFGALLQNTHGAIIDYPQSFDNEADAGLIARALGMCLVVASEEGNVWTPANDRRRPCGSVLKPQAPPTTPAVPSPSTPTLPTPAHTSPPLVTPPRASSR